MKLTQKMLDDIAKKLRGSSAPVTRNAKGEPVYLLHFYGTKKEQKVLQDKLNDLHDRK